MWDRRDQLQAYQFLRRRLVSALVFRSANNAESPSKRWITATITGLIVCLLIMGGFGLYGLFKGGASGSWTAGGKLIVEKETGAQFVLDSDQDLRPVLNYASAALFLGNKRPEVKQVSQKSLRIRPRGSMIGIPGAPDSVPTKESLIDGPWSVCSRSAIDEGGTPRPEVTLIVGAGDFAEPVAADVGVLASDPASATSYVIQEGRAYPLESEDVARVLGYADISPIPVGGGWLNALPRGGRLEFLDVPGAGGPGPNIADLAESQIGDVLSVEREGSDSEFFVVLADGVAPVNPTEAALILANPDNPRGAGDGRALAVPARVIAIAPESTESLAADFPAQVATPRRIETEEASICATASADGEAVAVSVNDSSPLGKDDSEIAIGGSDPAGPLADVVSIEPGRGGLVRETVAGGATEGTSYLVTDEGRRYPLQPEAAAAFGYSSSDLSKAPKGFLSLLPTGPGLSPEAAGVPIDPAEPVALPLGG
jgi:type VII secretion protein EccB